MATLTVRNLEDDLVRRLRIRAAEHGRSPEAEHREILRQALLGEGRMDRQAAAARLAEFRERTAVDGSPSVLELLHELRTQRLDALTRGGKGA